MMKTNEAISAIEYFLIANPEFKPFDVLIPENVALCEYNNKLVHVCVHDDSTLDYMEEME